MSAAPRLRDRGNWEFTPIARANAKFVGDYNNARIIADSGGAKAKAKPPTPKPPMP